MRKRNGGKNMSIADLIIKQKKEQNTACRLLFSNSTSRVPFGCAACGGPYPHCKTACPMYDD